MLFVIVGGHDYATAKQWTQQLMNSYDSTEIAVQRWHYKMFLKHYIWKIENKTNILDSF